MGRDAKVQVAAACRVSAAPLESLDVAFLARLTQSFGILCSVKKKIRADFEGRWGDRRQELVFIGEQIDLLRERLTAELDACLLDDSEWSQWQKVMKVSEVATFLFLAGRRGLMQLCCSQSKRSLARKVEKLESLFEDGWEDVRSDPVPYSLCSC